MNQQQLILNMYRSTRLVLCQVCIQRAILSVSFGRRQYAKANKKSIVKS